MVHAAYLRRGLWAMARAHRANGMAGHLGAALAAGHHFAETHRDLDRRVYSAIEAELDRIMAGEEQWFDPKEVGMTVAEMFEPLPDESARPPDISTIAEALSGNIDELHQSGHNVIFASIALRALHEHPELASPALIDGIRMLVEGFNDTSPGRQYFGKERGWLDGDRVSLGAEDDLPPYPDQQTMVEVVADETIDTASEHRQGCGGLWHIINHAAALTELSRLGYGALAHRGLAAHRRHVRLWRVLPNLEHELGPMVRAQHDPRTAAFWTTGPLKRDSARLTHRIKTLYGFFTLTRLVDNETRRQMAQDEFLYLMA
jgi:hypothetical protein